MHGLSFTAYYDQYFKLGDIYDQHLLQLTVFNSIYSPISNLNDFIQSNKGSLQINRMNEID